MKISDLASILDTAKGVAGDVELVLRHVEEAGVTTVIKEVEFALTGEGVASNVVTLAHGPADVVLTDPTASTTTGAASSDTSGSADSDTPAS
jgi:hypothetical protein